MLQSNGAMVAMLIWDAAMMLYLLSDSPMPERSPNSLSLTYQEVERQKAEAEAASMPPPTPTPPVPPQGDGGAGEPDVLCGDMLVFGQPWLKRVGDTEVRCSSFASPADCADYEDAKIACCVCGGGDEFRREEGVGFPMPTGVSKGTTAFDKPGDRPAHARVPTTGGKKVEIPPMEPTAGAPKNPKVKEWVDWMLRAGAAFFERDPRERFEPASPLCVPGWELGEGEAPTPAEHLAFHGYTHDEETEREIAEHSYHYIWCPRLVRLAGGACGAPPRSLAGCLPDGAALVIAGDTQGYLPSLRISTDMSSAGYVSQKRDTQHGEGLGVTADGKTFNVKAATFGHRNGADGFNNAWNRAKDGDAIIVSFGDSYSPWDQTQPTNIMRMYGIKGAAAKARTGTNIPEVLFPVFDDAFTDFVQIMNHVRDTPKNVKLIWATPFPHTYASTTHGLRPNSEDEAIDNPKSTHCMSSNEVITPILEYALAAAIKDFGVDLIDEVVDVASAVRNAPADTQFTLGSRGLGQCNMGCSDVNIGLAAMFSKAVCTAYGN